MRTFTKYLQNICWSNVFGKFFLIVINRYTPEQLLQILIPAAAMEVLLALSNEGFVLHACMLNNQHDLLIIMGTQLSLRL